MSAPTANLTLNGVKAGTYHYERNLTHVAVDSGNLSVLGACAR